MRIFYIIIWILFLIANFFKLSHFYGGDLGLLVSALLFLVFSVVTIFKIKPENKPKSWGLAAINVAMIYFVFRILFWPGSMIVFLIAFILFIIYLMISIREKRFLSPVSGIILAIFILSTGLFFSCGSAVYRNYQMNDIFSKEYTSTRYYPWYNYSWFLSQEHKQQEALEAMSVAEKLVNESYEKSKIPSDYLNRDLIRESRDKLLSGKWNEFKRLQ